MSDQPLRHSLGPFKLFAIAFGSIIGIGWITLVSGWLNAAGPLGSILAFGAGCVAVSLVGLAYAELALLLPEAGGEVAYANAAFGRPLAFVAGWALLMVYIAVIAFESISVGWVLGDIWPNLAGAGGVGSIEIIASVLTGLAIIWANIRAADLAASAQVLLMIVKVGVCVILIAAAFGYGSADHLPPVLGPRWTVGDWSGIASVFATSFLFYAGFNFLPQAIEERAPDVTVGEVVLAIMASIFCAFLFYALIILAIGMLLPVAQLSRLNLPAADAFEVALGSRALKNLVLAAGLVGLVTAWNGTLFGASRMVLFLGRVELLPPVFAKVGRTGTPVAAIVTISLVAMGVACLGKGAIGAIVGVAVAGVPLTWIIVTAAAFQLRRSRADAVRTFRVLAGPWVFIGGFLVSLVGTAIALRDVFDGASKLGLLALAIWWGSGLGIWGLARMSTNRKA